MSVHIALHEIGVEFERQLVSFTKREQHSPDYLAVNPEGQGPNASARRLGTLAFVFARRWPAHTVEGDAHAAAALARGAAGDRLAPVDQFVRTLHP